MDGSMGLWAWRAEGNRRLDGAVGMTGREVPQEGCRNQVSPRRAQAAAAPRLQAGLEGAEAVGASAACDRGGRRRRAGSACEESRAGPGRAGPGEVNASGHGESRCQTRGAGPRAILPRGAAARGRYGLTLLARGQSRLSSFPWPVRASHLPAGCRARRDGLRRCRGAGAPLPPPGQGSGLRGALAPGPSPSGSRERFPGLHVPGRGEGCACLVSRAPSPPPGLSRWKGRPAWSLWSGKRDVCLGCV